MQIHLHGNDAKWWVYDIKNDYDGLANYISLDDIDYYSPDTWKRNIL